MGRIKSEIYVEGNKIFDFSFLFNISVEDIYVKNS